MFKTGDRVVVLQPNKSFLLVGKVTKLHEKTIKVHLDPQPYIGNSVEILVKNDNAALYDEPVTLVCEAWNKDKFRFERILYKDCMTEAYRCSASRGCHVVESAYGVIDWDMST